MRKKLGLALGSGGSRGVAHIGFLKALEENGVKPDLIAGTSMGSVVGAAYASGLSPDDMHEAVGSLRLLDLLEWTRGPNGFFGLKKIRKQIVKHVGERTFDELKIPFGCVAVDLCAQEKVVFLEGNVADAVVASSAIPTIFKPFEKDGKKYVDGGVFERVPVRLVKDMGADIVVAVDVLGQRPCGVKKKGVVGALFETVDLMDNYRTRKCRQEHAEIIDLWIEPDLGDASQYSLKSVETIFTKGYRAGKEYAEKIEKLLQ